MAKPTTEIDNGQLKAPTAIPKKIAIIHEDETPAQLAEWWVASSAACPEDRLAGSSAAFSVPSSRLHRLPFRRWPPRQRVKVSQGVTQGLRIRMVQPTYPPLAKQARISGSVVLQAVISKDGSIENLKAVSGHPMLIQSALDAVRQWKYKPYFLNGEPVEVETQITVNFTLAGG